MTVEYKGLLYYQFSLLQRSLDIHIQLHYIPTELRPRSYSGIVGYGFKPT